MNMFRISSASIDSDAVRDKVMRPGCGAYATFEGRVRDNQDGRAVMLLEYEAYRLLGEKEGNRIIDEALSRYEISDAMCIHRTGALYVGDLAVLVGVSAPHRDEAFRACHFIIDEVKSRLPIWKKETYRDGGSQWVNCDHCGHTQHAQPDYSRQVILKEIGEDGQKLLKNAKVLVIGAGGLGCPALQYLAAAGVGAISIVDHDRVDASNLHRQILYGAADIGEPKAEVAARKLRQMNPTIEVSTFTHKLDAENIEREFSRHDIVLDCTDSFDAKYLINDAAVLTKTPVVFSSVYQYEGQLHVYRPSDGSACLRCLWPERAEAPSCAESGVLGPVPGVLGTLQALEVIKILVGMSGSSGLGDQLVLVNLLDYSIQRIKAPRCRGCLDAGQCKQITSLEQWHRDADLEVAFETVDDARDAGFCLIDIRDESEIATQPLACVPTQKMPISQLENDLSSLSLDKRYLLVCARGIRSKRLSGLLRSRGYEVYSLAGGVAGIARLNSGGLVSRESS